ncbi:rhodanese-like domain-containing protein [Algibacter sp. 2305UL17-15]|uniref:rhodanese-like domain-containing protein n=1 Tax=Algibacter sp. 2305UL17-15 TaxID=3231268 RepID=UPI00345B4676
MKKVLFIFLSFMAGSCQLFTQNESVKLNSEAFKVEISKANVQLVDVRKPDEFATSHLKNAKNLNYFSESFADNVKLLDTTAPVFIYCRSGKRSAKSVSVFKEAGFETIYELEGGILNWNNSHLKTTSE